MERTLPWSLWMATVSGWVALICVVLPGDGIPQRVRSLLIGLAVGMVVVSAVVSVGVWTVHRILAALAALQPVLLASQAAQAAQTRKAMQEMLTDVVNAGRANANGNGVRHLPTKP